MMLVCLRACEGECMLVSYAYTGPCRSPLLDTTQDALGIGDGDDGSYVETSSGPNIAKVVE